MNARDICDASIYQNEKINLYLPCVTSLMSFRTHIETGQVTNMVNVRRFCFLQFFLR